MRDWEQHTLGNAAVLFNTVCTHSPVERGSKASQMRIMRDAAVLPVMRRGPLPTTANSRTAASPPEEAPATTREGVFWVRRKGPKQVPERRWAGGRQGEK